MRGSLTTQLCWASSWVLWLCYFVSIQSWPQVAGGVLGLLVEGCMVVLLLRCGQSASAVLRAVLWSSTGLAGCALLALLSREWMAAGLTGMDGASLLPALLLALRAPDLGGVSFFSWGLKASSAAAWLLYGIGIGHPMGVAWTAAILPCALVMCWRLLRYRRRSGPLSVAPSPMVPALASR